MSIAGLSIDKFTRLLGLEPDPKDPRDFKLRFDPEPILKISRKTVKLPTRKVMPVRPKYDLRAYMPVIKDQGGYPHCAAYAASAGLNYFNKVDVGEHVNFYEPWVYDEARKVAGMRDPMKGGVYLRSVLKLAHKIGVMPRKEWSVLLRRPKKKGSSLEQALSNYRIESYASVEYRDTEAVKEAISTFGPLFCGVKVYDSWRQVGRDGQLPDNPSNYLGGHAILLVGWDDDTSQWIFRNSWGAWGDDGYGYLDYRYLYDNCFSCWSAIDIRGSKDLYDPTDWEKFRDSKLPKELKKAFGIPF
jgi:C1A family cysteine protease